MTKLYRSDSYFTTEEFSCGCGCEFGTKEEHISEKLICYLNDIREWLGRPMVVTSGARCEDYNIVIGGSSKSAHMPSPNDGQCKAVDILIKGNHERFELLRFAIYRGFKRIGIGDDFIHLDVSDDLPPETVWLY